MLKEKLFTASANTFYGILSTIICDIGKLILGRRKDANNVYSYEKVLTFVESNIDKEFSYIFESSVFLAFISSPLVIDTIGDYVVYTVTGQVDKKLQVSKALVGCDNRLELEKVVTFLSDKLMDSYKASETVVSVKYIDLQGLLRNVVKLVLNYNMEIISSEELIEIFLINNRINYVHSSVEKQLDKILKVLNQYFELDVKEDYESLKKNKNEYIKMLKENQRIAHIYLLDKFDINKFYVPPYLSEHNIKNILTLKLEMGLGHVNNHSAIKGGNNCRFDDWRFIFDRSNIVYVTGGAGYGKSLFMKKLIEDYENLNIIAPEEYMVIYGELKNFINEKGNVMPVVDYLQECMKKETLLDESVVSKELIRYYLKLGRCIVLLDALDEVGKDKRQELHSHVINFFKGQNPNNKVCITSRTRGFIPEKNIIEFSIEPLDAKQISAYVDKIIELGKFDKSDRENFMKQSSLLVKKNFLNSFLMLSLLINIYKAERELPENKLELYQKCFEYISNKREKEKSYDKYNWGLISYLMKDYTFMELARLCMPNNKDVAKDKIIGRLTEVYKGKYVSENETYLAINQFLLFCSDRTELFVPASGEDCFKFFHRSFFEYFCSLYIFSQNESVDNILKSFYEFDIDSEVFELTLAMFKQKNEVKYQAIVDKLFQGIACINLSNKGRLYNLNVLVLCMQVIDDKIYKDRFVEYLCENKKFVSEHINEISNQHIILNLINADDMYLDKICSCYEKEVKFEFIYYVLRMYTESLKTYTLLEYEMNIEGDKKVKARNPFMARAFADASGFYTLVYYEHRDLGFVFDDLSIEDIDELGKSLGKPAKLIEKVKNSYEKFKELKTEDKEKIKKLI
jgi:hypothetical protein